ncbi:hypothetical protein THAOC_30421 [Thalassiosira oceanica]|uniref:Uncharacterized protein n=1 Tax=Thalassiosira oceanica TaxID=159749 RepID=K0RA84_THAOC|nr:hypothetical protein THAOC_30421 [Thalassiosira oceanica]|eukprot:EJK50553.1 hypothetical protein THAOC_30421 [Thalassiosira oceanica]
MDQTESESASSSTTASCRLSEPLPEPSEPRCHYERRASWASITSSSARSLLSVESSCTEASEFPDFGITATLAPRELQEMLEMGTDSSGANSDTSSDGGNGPVHVLAAGSTTKPSGTQPRRPLRRSSFCKDSRSTPMTKSRRRRVTFNDGVIPKLNAVKEANHPGEGQRDEVAELRLELCNQKRLIADLLARMESLEQRNSASVPEDVNDVSEPSHTACDEHRQIDELKLELANERGRNAAISSRVTDVEARNRTLEGENEELRRAVAEIQDKMASFRGNIAKTLTQSGKSSGTEETVIGISSSDSDSNSVCSDIFTQSTDEVSCLGERKAREEAEGCC